MRRSDLVGFLADPSQMNNAADPGDVTAWEDGLDLGNANVDLRDAQGVAWAGIAPHRGSLVLGPPGTGKTFLLSWMAAAFIASCREKGRPCRILATALTHAAIGNLLEAIAAKLAVLGDEAEIRYLNGPDGPIVGLSHRDLRGWLAREHSVLGATSWQLHRALESGATGAQAQSADLFDLICIDEASQLKVDQGLLVLGALGNRGRFIAAGDNRQLPPVGTVADWEVGGLPIGGSFYDFLLRGMVPEFALDETDRLNRVLTAYPRQRFYDRYAPTATAAEGRLHLADGWEGGLPSWLRETLNPEHPVVVLLYDGPPAATRNPPEASVVEQIVRALRSRVRNPDGTEPDAVTAWTDRFAVVSPHRRQNAEIRQHLAGLGDGDAVVVETVERIQGQERDAVIMSFTVSDPEFALAEASFLFSAERFNVAMTRARHKFVLLINRSLCQIVPSDEAVFDAAQAIREFVYASEELAGSPVRLADSQLDAAVRVRRFDDTVPLPDLSVPAVRTSPEPLPESTDHLRNVLEAIREYAAASDYGNAASFTVEERFFNQTGFADYLALFRLGHLRMEAVHGKQGLFWRLTPLDDGVTPWSIEPETVEARIVDVVMSATLGRRARYVGHTWRGVQDHFVWMNAAGHDALLGQLQQLAARSVINLEQDSTGKWLLSLPGDEPAEPLAPLEPLADADFGLLNTLEDIEVGRIDYGVVESWAQPRELARETGRPEPEVGQALERLADHGWVLWEPETRRVRSRMAELARSLRYVKRRFRKDDADDAPFLVRSVRVAVRNRDKPLRSERVDDLLADMRSDFGDGPWLEVLRFLGPLLGRRSGRKDPRVAGFQRRAIRALVGSWIGESSDDTFVVTADTGAGKTEAACLPLLFGAAIDRAAGIKGVRSVLVYPRIRLGVNQAARIAWYASQLAELGGPLVTVGLQNGDVPTALSGHLTKAQARLWEKEGDTWKFPFFECPQPGCGKELRLTQGSATGPGDLLHCHSCGWEFAGWHGSKNRIRTQASAIFMPVTESLHQWMQDPQYGRLFGDDAPNFMAPRAVLADEIHLYGLISGAQVGYTLQRLMARVELNGGPPPLAVGMSATLGDPTRMWGELTGRGRARVVAARPAASERVVNPRGREYFYLVQPEVESRGSNIDGASTTIQALMCLTHGMRRRTGMEGGYRGLVFLDSVDKLKRLRQSYADAEERRRLARLRTRHYPDDPQSGQPRNECCGTPATCSLFRDGECWTFAATDARQVKSGPNGTQLHRPGSALRVMRYPVFSGASGRVDRDIAHNDIVFATSSLEVGFDDPEIALVYQQYAPTNLAAFAQRKGRAGRGTDDRPVTGVTLSVYSPRDTLYFRRPERLLEPRDFEVPLNMGNWFVRYGQVLSLVLDLVARHQRQNTEIGPRQLGRLHPTIEPVVRRVYGDGIFSEFDVGDLEALWAEVLKTSPHLTGRPRDWREQIEWVPTRLFDPINLPLLTVRYTERGETQSRVEDVALGLAEMAPGRVTRRWGSRAAHWIRYGGRRAPMVPGCREFPLQRDQSAGVAGILPTEVVAALGGEIHPMCQRPVEVTVEEAGFFDDNNDWQPFFAWNGTDIVPFEHDSGHRSVFHKSHSTLRGFVVVTADQTQAHQLPIASLQPLGVDALRYFRGMRGRGQPDPGLWVIQAYWAADWSLQLKSASGATEREHLRQVFVHPGDTDQSALFGYGMTPEGIQLALDREQIVRFVDETLATLQADHPRLNWHRSQYVRWHVASRMSASGIDLYRSRQLAELLVTTLADSDLRAALEEAVHPWDSHDVFDLLQRTRTEFLAFHPQLSESRIEALEDLLVEREVREAVGDAIAAYADAAPLRSFLASQLLHGISVRLHQDYVVTSRADPRGVISFVRLPSLYDGPWEPVVTVCERGSGGDGTTRTFLRDAPAVFDAWRDDGIVVCENAAADDAVDRAFAMEDRHEAWLAQDPRDPVWVRRLAGELSIPEGDTVAIQLVLSLVYGQADLGPQRFRALDLHRELRCLRTAVTDRLLREPTEWELVGAAVHAAQTSDPLVPGWSALLAAYTDLTAGMGAAGLDPANRLADLVVRLGARLCVDGCLGCLHTGGSSADRDMVPYLVSRTLLESFHDWTYSNAQPSTAELEEELYPPRWLGFLGMLTAQAHVDPGADVTDEAGVVVGTTVAVVTRADGAVLHLVDDAAPWAEDVLIVSVETTIRVGPGDDPEVVLGWMP